MAEPRGRQESFRYRGEEEEEGEWKAKQSGSPLPHHHTRPLPRVERGLLD